jgi:subtilase family serine protease
MRKALRIGTLPTVISIAMATALSMPLPTQAATPTHSLTDGLSTDTAAQAKQSALQAVPAATMHVTKVIDNKRLTALQGTVRALANSKNDKGKLPSSLETKQIQVHVQLKRDPARQAALDAYLVSVSDPSSPLYQKWLTAKELGEYFGPSQADISAVTDWLTRQGLTATAQPSGVAIDASGTVTQLAKAFKTSVHQYDIGGEMRFANANEISVPTAITSVVEGVTSLDNFRPIPLHTAAKPLYFDSKSKHWQQLEAPAASARPGGDLQAMFTVTANNEQMFLLGPADFATVYNVTPLRSGKQPLTGKGRTVTLLGGADAKAADWLSFRKEFGLSQYKSSLTITHPGGCENSGLTSKNLVEESSLDVDAVSFAAPEADVVLASCDDLIAGANALLSQDTPPEIISMSYGTCDARSSAAAKAFNALWQQAAAEGTSVFVSSGDQLSAVCDRDNGRPIPASSGLADNAWGDSAYNVSVGGTDFSDYADSQITTYWSQGNNPGDSSALSYVPEIPWNDSCASSVLYTYAGSKSGLDFCNSTRGQNFLGNDGGSGGQSLNAKPAWQAGVPGIVKDKTRDTPDVSLFASNGFYSHSVPICDSVQYDSKGNLIPGDANLLKSTCSYGSGVQGIGGTSFSSPAFAGIQALINQKKAKVQGNPNPRLYALAATQYNNAKTLASCDASKGNATSAACIFHDVTRGDIATPCIATTPDCYVANSKQNYGILSTSTKALKPAYPATKGWDFATGLGSVNAAKLVDAW